MFYQWQLDRLDEAISLGVKEVTYGDKKTVYQDLGEMIALRERMQTEISGHPTLADRRRTGVVNMTINNRNCGGHSEW